MELDKSALGTAKGSVKRVVGTPSGAEEGSGQGELSAQRKKVSNTLGDVGKS